MYNLRIKNVWITCKIGELKDIRYNRMHIHLLYILKMYWPALACFAIHIIVLYIMSYVMYIA